MHFFSDYDGDLPDDWEDDYAQSPDYVSEEEFQSSESEEPLSDSYIEDNAMCSENDATDSDDSLIQNGIKFYSERLLKSLITQNQDIYLPSKEKACVKELT